MYVVDGKGKQLFGEVVFSTGKRIFIQRSFHGKQMVIGTGKIKLELYDITSLKEKRSIVRSLMSRIGNKFNISIAETNYNDSHLWAEVGFALVSNNSRVANSKIDKVLNSIEEIDLAQIADFQREIIHL